MFRVLTIFLILIQVGMGSYGQTDRSTILLKNGILTASQSLLHHPLSNSLWQSSRYDGKYFIAVQLDKIADSRQKALLAAQGVQLGQFLTGKTYLAIVTPGLYGHNAPPPGIRNLYVLPSELKMSASLRNGAGGIKSEKDLISVSCYPLDKNQIERSLRETGADIVETRIKPAHTWFIRRNPAVLEKLARLPFIISISPLHLEDVPLNYNNRAAFGVNSLSSNVGRSLTGKNLVLGIGDNADPSTHIDLAGKLIMRTDEPVADHGTHTSGTLIGGGILNPMYTGMAPRAHLVVNDFSNILVNSSTYISDYKMYLTSNSYYNGAAACEGDGEYNALSNYLDSQTLYYPNLLHVFAAGNDGAITCTPYPASFATIKSGFQTAKNVLTVGSMNNLTYTIGTGSSRGPVFDGRIKPEIVAGGVSIVSTVSFNNYWVMTGTSMACPTAAGIIALVTERYRQMNGGAFPDAALLKALVANSADDLGNPGPDFTYGFGMINGRTTVEALEQNHYINGTVADNGSQQITIPSLPAGAYQLKMMLYWPDAPALPMAATALVNDLDLQVADPLGASHLPLILDPSPAGLNNNAVEGVDHTNNMEQVVINNPPAGNYTVTVKGNSIPSGTQSFYLVYEIIQPSVTVEYPFGGETWLPNTTEDIRWSAYGGDPNGFTLEYSPDGGSSWNLISNSIPSSARSYSWLVPNIVSSKALIRVTRNSVGYSDISDYAFTILDQPITNGHQYLPWICPAELEWNQWCRIL